MKTPETTLRAIDEALDSGTVTETDAELRELQELALLLRDDVPEPDSAFATRMAGRRFGTESRWAATRSRLTAVPRAPVLAGAASVIFALVVALGVLGGDPPRERAASGGAEAARAPGAGSVSADDAVAGEALPSPPPGGGSVAPGASERRIERSAQLGLEAPEDEIGETADGIVSVTDRHGGFVIRSETSAGEQPGGEFDLRIPEARLRAALRDLSALATVTSRSEQGQDVTPAYEGTRERLAEVRADRRGLLRRLERATTDAERTVIHRRLRLVSAEIRSLQTQFKSIREGVEFASVSVTLAAGDSDGGAGRGAAVDAWDDALASLEGSLAFALRALGALLVPALLAGLGLLGARGLRRRRREAALS